MGMPEKKRACLSGSQVEQLHQSKLIRRYPSELTEEAKRKIRWLNFDRAQRVAELLSALLWVAGGRDIVALPPLFKREWADAYNLRYTDYVDADLRLLADIGCLGEHPVKGVWYVRDCIHIHRRLQDRADLKGF